MKLNQIEGRRCLITGTSSGIGEEISKLLQCHGYAVEGLQRRPPGTHADLSEINKVDSAWEASVKNLGRLPDLLVLNAGQSLGCRFEDTEVEDLSRLITLNATTPFRLAQLATRAWKAENILEAHIIFIGSQAALPGAHFKGNALYAATKSFVHGLVVPLAEELGPNIRVNAVAPGDVYTPLAKRSLERRAQIYDQKVEDIYESIAISSPIKRWISPSEIAEAVYFLDRCTAINSCVLNISGGKSSH